MVYGEKAPSHAAGQPFSPEVEARQQSSHGPSQAFSLIFTVPWEVTRIGVQIFKWENWSRGRTWLGSYNSSMASQVRWLITELLFPSLGCICVCMCVSVCTFVSKCVYAFSHFLRCVHVFACTSHADIYLCFCVCLWDMFMCVHMSLCVYYAHTCMQMHSLGWDWWFSKENLILCSWWRFRGISNCEVWASILLLPLRVWGSQ